MIKLLIIVRCEFWLTFADQDGLKDCLYPYLPKVLPVLLKCMVYSEDDMAVYLYTHLNYFLGNGCR